ncbi:MAG: gliding motility-associated C-terminal domain-containing protein [Bacteroidia bacterium]|nr:gliding motility-associated C-terminal domain-containing protein [Bacteroidia bacterium]
MMGLLLLSCTLCVGQGQTFSCDDAFFLSGTKAPGQPSFILSAKPDAIGPTLVWDTLVANTQHHIGPMGYSVWDNYLYALDTATFELLKIDATGHITVCTSLASRLDTTLLYQAGCVTPPGIKFTIVGRNRLTQSDQRMYNIRLDRADYQVGNNSLVTQGQLQIEDLAYHPHFGVLYGYEAVNRRIVQIVGGLATGFNFQSAPAGTVLSGLFFDKEGTLFGYGKVAGSNGLDNTLFRIDTKNGQLSPLKSIFRSSRSDACSCPYSITLRRSFYPAQALPCDTVDLVYSFTNHSGFIYRDVHLTDNLPDGLRIVSLGHKPFGTTLEALGSDSLRVTLSDLSLQSDSLVFRVVIDSAMVINGGFSPAILDSFPVGIGYEIFSEETARSSLSVAELEVDLGTDQMGCFAANILLVPVVSGAANAVSYRWSDGSEGSQLLVNQSGTYVVQVENGCLKASDTVDVELASAPFWVQLADEKVIEEGNSFLLNVLTNGMAPFTYEWSGPQEADLSCTSCASPIARPLEDVTLSVTVIDAFGCLASDSIRILVNKVRDIVAPNVFTPNNDGFQDVFYLRGEANGSMLNFQIFDRWGRVAFRQREGRINTPQDGWNGIINGQQAEPGVYFWTSEVEYADGSRQRFRGNVTLMR